MSREIPADRKLASWRLDQSGNVAIVFALMAVVLMLAVGAAVDIGRWLHARDQTISAVDATLLAAGRYLQTNQNNPAGAIATAQTYYAQNVASRLPVTGDTVSFVVGSDGMSVTASGSAYIQTPFLQLASIDKLPLISTTTTQFSQPQIAVGGNGGQRVEISLVLDETGSMVGQKLTDLQTAAKDLVDTVIWADQSTYYSKVALIPYTMGVNVGSQAAQVRGSFSSGTCTSPGCQSYNFTSATGSTDTFSISNCVTERTGTNAYTDVAPSTAPLGPNYPASTNPCLPLTSDKTLLENQIETSFRTVDASEVGEDGHVMKGGIAFTVNASDQPAK